MSFNKYQFIEGVKSEIASIWRSDGDYLSDDIIYQEVDNACIYYSTCIEIIQELGAYSWEEGEVNISQVAYNALLEYVFGEIDVESFIQELEEEKEEEDE